jgi:hypothetical protein
VFSFTLSRPSAPKFSKISDQSPKLSLGGGIDINGAGLTDGRKPAINVTMLAAIVFAALKAENGVK